MPRKRENNVVTFRIKAAKPIFMFECEMWIMKSKDTRMLGPQQMQFLCQPPDDVNGPYVQHSVRKAIIVEGNEKQSR